MSNKSLKFRFSNERPLDLEPYTVYFIKAEGQTNITIVADDPENFASVSSYAALEDIINARFKAFGNTQKEARDAISAVGVSELAKVFFSSDVHYFPTNTLNNSLEELEFGKYLISFTQDPKIELPPFSGQSFFYLEVKNSYSVATDGGRILEATAYNTGVRAIKVCDTEKRWSTWCVVAFETSNVASSTKLQTARTIGSVSFDGTADINLPGVNTAGNQDTTGNAATATKLKASVQVGGVAFDGSASINLPGVNTVGNQNTSGNAGTATKLQTARTLTLGNSGKAFDGSANVSWTADEVLPTGTNGQVLKHNGTSWVAGTDNNTTYSNMSEAEANAGTATTERVITAAVLKTAINTHAPAQTTVTGNAGSATKLATACSLTIGGTSKNFDGSANVTWTLAEIDAAAASHTHSYLPLTGGTLTGNLNLPVVTETAVALGTGNSLNLASGSVFSKTITAATTLTLTNTPASGSVCSFILEITNGGNFAVTWWPGIKWPDDKVPTLTSNGTDNIGFYTTDGGVTWKVLGMFNG